MSETPLLTQYKSLKEKNRDTLLAFRIGDFYEFLYDDAQVASKVLGITLTSKPLYKNHRAPLAGIPAKAAWQYFEKLVRNGFKVAICEQLGEGKKLMEREIVEVLTPGTFYHPDFSDETEHIFIGSLTALKSRGSIAIGDIGTGEILLENGNVEELMNLVETYNVREVLVEDELYFELRDRYPLNYTRIASPLVAKDSMIEKICNFFGVPDIKIINLQDDPLEVRSIFNLITYLEEKKPGMLNHLKTIKRINTEKVLKIDAKTAKHLELLQKPYGDLEDTLYEHLKETITPQGSRYLKETILTPPKDINLINERLCKVEFFVTNRDTHQKVREILRKISDLERIISRFSTQKFHVRDFLRLAESVKAYNEIQNLLGNEDLFAFPQISKDFESLIKTIEYTIEDDPTASPPGWLKKGVNQELDELKFLLSHSKEKLLEMERKEREKTGIPNLRIGYNQVFGFYYEVTKSHLDKVPSYFIRKQTLQNAERFYTEELKELEEKLLSAEEKIVSIEKEIVENLRNSVLDFTREIVALTNFIKELDLIQAFAEVSRNYKYTKPAITTDKRLLIKDGRHPVVEKNLKSPFIPNDTVLDTENTIMYIITGPNMSGKSTYLRQVAIIVIMAHMGCFVPATYAEIPLTDRIFARIGASDDITKGVSTFMAEMLETAEIMRNATSDSLLILDEIGRGTATTDGIAIAWACAEYILERIKAKTLFATHYHELSEIARIHPHVKNYHMKVAEWEGNIVFLRKLVEGVANKSYGIHVAALSGLPKEIIERAKEIAGQLERKEAELLERVRANVKQLNLFERVEAKKSSCKICEELTSLDIDGISPREALNLLYKLREELDRCLGS